MNSSQKAVNGRGQHVLHRGVSVVLAVIGLIVLNFFTSIRTTEKSYLKLFPIFFSETEHGLNDSTRSNVNDDPPSFSKNPTIPQNLSLQHKLKVLNVSTFRNIRTSIFDDPIIGNDTMPNTLSACVLMKDDNDILNEWIAYHFHLWNLRRLIIAVDPSSETSPRTLLDQWDQTFPPFGYELWEDEDYLPDWFIKNGYPNVLFRKPPQKLAHKKFTKEEIHQISNHMYRQREFYKQCLHFFDQHPPKSLMRPTSQMVMLIDTDEFLALNPWLLQTKNPTMATKKFQLQSMQPTAGSLLQMLVDSRASQHDPSPCIELPRLLIGGVERINVNLTHQHIDNENLLLWNTSLFETIRWKYHAPMVVAGPLNGPPKALIDLQTFRDRTHSFKRHRQHESLMNNIYSIHRPNNEMCPKSVSMDGSSSGEEESGPPRFTFYHYLGSTQRFLSRKDPRRDEQVRGASIALIQGCTIH